ncbi:MAG TPA: hypothetical protein VFR02_00710, partial [bacterium]|nr:hypothetical protein [bacterium]
ALAASPLAAQTPAPAAGPALGETLYQQALDSYLGGDYDQAILLAAKSVEADPQNAKAQSLLGLLTKEKKDIGKYEIWLSTGQGKVPEGPAEDGTAALASSFQGEIQRVQSHFDHFYRAQTLENGRFQGQIQAVSELLRENSDHQYDELRKSQTDILQQIQAMNEGRERNLWILYLLCLVSMLFSCSALWAILRRPRGRG